MDELKLTSKIAAAGLKAQAERLRVVAQNLANADSLPSQPGEEPYRRQVVSFRNVLDRQLGVEKVTAEQRTDSSQFRREYDPSHPAADAEGYVLAPNVNPLIELMDMREAQRSYEANLNVIRSAKALMSRTVELLR